MLTLRPTWEWDVAAGDLIVTEAGGKVSDMANASPIYNNKHPQLAGMIAGAGLVQTTLVSQLSQGNA
jgi:myo-inositol-1(or 4)-monophosphatase